MLCQKTEPDIALVGRAAWWVAQPALPTNKKRKLSFAEALTDFLQNFSFHCYAKLVEAGRRVQERFFWLVFHITALTILIIFLWNTRISESDLLTTTIYDSLYPIEMVAFPAVAICTVNRISDASAWRYARKLSQSDPLMRGVEYFYEQIRLLSYNYMIDMEDFGRSGALGFQQFLDTYDTEDPDMFYNTKRHMSRLTPECDEIFVKCQLAGRDFACSELFATALTIHGYCCIFNYNGKYSKPRPFNMSLYGSDRGLAVLLNASSSDNFYKISGTDGFLVSVFSSKNYADVRSGAVFEYFTQRGEDSYLKVTPTILETVNEARFLSIKARQCIFTDELPSLFGNSYSFNQCITACRIRSILVLCNCLMFTTPLHYLDASTDTVYCTLQHLQCIWRYDFKWANVITKRANVSGLEREMEDALYCPDCYPSCSETSYIVSKVDIPLHPYNMRAFTKDIDSNNTDLAMLRVFFGEPHCKYFEEILQNSWYEILIHLILGRIGNICGVIAGFSLVGICEILFFLVCQLCTAYEDEMKLDRNRKIKPTQEQLIILP